MGVPLVVGAVLCGGASRRMGRDKALLPFDGIAMAARVAAALRAGGCDEVIAIGGDAAGLAELGLETVSDEFPGEGPLGGVITALASRPEADAVMVVACDLPALRPATVAALLSAAPRNDVVVAVEPDGRRQPVCAVWRPSTVVRLRHAFDGGERRLIAAVELLQSVAVEVETQDLANVNTPDDLRD